jgi:hypothetical protein
MMHGIFCSCGHPARLFDTASGHAPSCPIQAEAAKLARKYDELERKRAEAIRAGERDLPLSRPLEVWELKA